MVWFVERERKIAKLSKTTFTYRMEESGSRIEKKGGLSDLWKEKKRGVSKRAREEERMRRMQRGSS